MKRVAILQSNYIPWKGYFDLIDAVDEFVFYDDVQYTKNDWRNRNRIKTPQGVQWLTIPVRGTTHQTVRSIEIAASSCGAEHWQRLSANYARASCFRQIADWAEPLFRDTAWDYLSAVNQRLIGAICDFLHIPTMRTDCAIYRLAGDRNERLVSICQQAEATTYVSGPSARAYLDVAAFEKAGVQVEWFDYDGYQPYRQLWGPFVHQVTVLDLLFNCGDDARSYLKASRA